MKIALIQKEPAPSLVLKVHLDLHCELHRWKVVAPKLELSNLLLVPRKRQPFHVVNSPTVTERQCLTIILRPGYFRLVRVARIVEESLSEKA